MPKIPEINPINMVSGIRGTIKTLTKGDIKETLSKLYKIIGKVRICAAKVIAVISLILKKSGINFSILLR